MNFADLITPGRVMFDAHAASRKGALELLSRLIADGTPELAQTAVFDSLVARERLSGTGLGRGVALPHGRLKNLPVAAGAFIRLATGVDFDANDKQPVDLLFALAVPEEATEEHLQILARLARMFSDPQLRDQLRLADSSAALYDLLTHWQAPD